MCGFWLWAICNYCSSNVIEFCDLWISRKCICRGEREQKPAQSMMVYITQRRQMMWTHSAETGSTKPNTRGISHLNAKPTLTPCQVQVGTSQKKLKLESDGK